MLNGPTPLVGVFTGSPNVRLNWIDPPLPLAITPSLFGVTTIELNTAPPE